MDLLKLSFLEDNWKSLANFLELPENISEYTFSLLKIMYSDSRRHYHTLDHIYDLLTKIHDKNFNAKINSIASHNEHQKNSYDRRRKKIEEESKHNKFVGMYYPHYPSMMDEKISLHDEMLLTLSIWFHDVYYSGHSGIDEKLSAQLLQSIKSFVSNDKKACITNAMELVLLTETHNINSNKISIDNIQTIFLDLDMSILASNKEEYKIYSENIIKEYSNYFNYLPVSEIKNARMNFLQDLLKRDRIFFVTTNLEDLARENIKSEIVELQKFLEKEFIVVQSKIKETEAVADVYKSITVESNFIAPEYIMANGEELCSICGNKYEKHPFTMDRDWAGEPYLTVLCDSKVVRFYSDLEVDLACYE